MTSKIKKGLRYTAKKASQFFKNIEFNLTPTTEPCKTYEDLRDYCYKAWGMSEGRCSDIYTDCMGYPTTGTGFLIYSPKGNGSRQQQKDNFTSMEFSWKGKVLSKEQKEKLFDQIVKDYEAGKLGKNKRKLYPRYRLTDRGHKAEFDRRFKAWYDIAKPHHKDLHKMPRSLAQSMMHLYWWGKGTQAKEIKGTYVQQANSVYLYMKGGGAYGLKGNDQLIKDGQQAVKDAKAVSKKQSQQSQNKQSRRQNQSRGGR